jgi:predicted ArsR family transcriptional regulator
MPFDSRRHTALERPIAALGDRTRRTILLGFYDDPRARTVDEVAAAAGVHRTVAFQHLERLVALGYLTADRRRGFRGKPAKVYQLASAPIEVSYPARLHRPLAGLLARTLERLGSAASAASHDVGRDFGRSLGRAAQDVPEALTPLHSLGGRYAMQPGDVLAATNCLFREACEEAPQVVCGLHAGMLEGLLRASGQPRRVAPLGPRSGGGCAFTIEEAGTQ